MVNHQLDVLFPQEENQHVRVIAEPGRYYAASAFTLATNVIAKRDVARDLPTDENLADGGDFIMSLMYMPKFILLDSKISTEDCFNHFATNLKRVLFNVMFIHNALLL